MDVCEFRLSACFWFWHSERERKGVYGLGGLWRIVWCMEIGAIGFDRNISIPAFQKFILNSRSLPMEVDLGIRLPLNRIKVVEVIKIVKNKM